MRKALLLSSLLLSLILTSCSMFNSPSSAVKSTLNCLIAKDYDGAMDYIYIEAEDEDSVSAEDVQAAKHMAKSLLEKAAAAQTNNEMKSFEIKSEKKEKDGDVEKATVEVEETFSNGETKTKEIKVIKNKKGDWKVIL